MRIADYTPGAACHRPLRSGDLYCGGMARRHAGGGPPAGPALPFADRHAAGRDLAGRLGGWAGEPDLLVLGLARGGVPVAFEVARAHRAPLDVFLVRKLGVPGHEELALGAVASGGARVLNRAVIDAFGLSRREVDAIAAGAAREIEAGETELRGGRPALPPAGRAVALVDDGLATGATIRAAIAALRLRRPARVLVAVPVAEARACAALRAHADGFVCAATPEPFGAVGMWYEDFAPVPASEVRRLVGLGRDA